jgi:hypothetical protein
MAWKNGRWIKPVKEIVSTRVGPNSVRYEARTIPDPPKTFAPVYARNKAPRRTYWGEDDSYDYDDTRTYTTHLIQPPKKKFAWAPTRWSSFSFSSFLDDDDNDDLFVKEPEAYNTPTASEIRNKVNVYGKIQLDRIKDLARVCYFKMVDDRDYIAEKYRGQEGESSYEAKKEMYDNVFETFVPGHTPLEQAIAIHHKLEDNDSAKDNSVSARQGRSRRFEFRRDDYCDPAINCQMELNPLSKKRKMEILNKISIIGDLGSQFKVEKETGEKVVTNSNMYRKRIMRDYEQFNRIEIYQKLFPNFRAKFLTKDLVVNVPVQTSEKKQKIIVLCDYSGSMDEEEKQVWVNAILIDRFRYVIRGEAELYFSHFVSNPSGLKFTHIKNARDVIEFWKTFSNRPSGSMTDIGRIVTYISEEVNKGKFHNLKLDLSKERPEILIINDGQDEVGYKTLPYKVNAISLIEFSKELKNLCVATGGKQIEITEKNKIYSYSKEGGKEVKEKVKRS